MKEQYSKYSRHGSNWMHYRRMHAHTLTKCDLKSMAIQVICKINNEDMGFINNKYLKYLIRFLLILLLKMILIKTKY